MKADDSSINVNHNITIETIVKDMKNIPNYLKEDLHVFLAVFLNCLEIQLPNKKRMAVRALLNGYSFDTEAKML